MQADLREIEAAGVQVVGISYDSVEVLAKFAGQRKITFPLLSDPDSKTITAYGLLNRDAKGKTAGIPYPGTMVVDRGGVIRAKLFLEGYRDRHATKALIKAARDSADDSDVNPTKPPDEAALQGTWKLVSVETEGQSVPPKKLKESRLVFVKDRMLVKEEDKVLDEYIFALDVEKSPKRIDLKAVAGPRTGQTILGIYEIKGDVLQLCDGQSNRRRPDTFKTRPDSAFITISLVLQRERR